MHSTHIAWWKAKVRLAAASNTRPPVTEDEAEVLFCLALITELETDQWYRVIKKFNEIRRNPKPALEAVGREYSGKNSPSSGAVTHGSFSSIQPEVPKTPK